MKKANLKNKKGMATVLGLVVAVAIGSIMVGSFINKAADSNGYVTKDKLMEQVSNSEGEHVQKIFFGKNEDGSAQEWYLVGKDETVSGENVVIVAANPIKKSQVFEDEGKRNKKDTSLWADCTYKDGGSITEVHPNHYGASDLRAQLKAMLEDNIYFSDAQKAMMNETTILSYDTRNRVEYTTTDTLYALSNVDGTLRAGSNNDVPVDLGEVDWFWLRTTNDFMKNKGDALTADDTNASTNVSVDMSRGVLPATNLDLSSVLFASAAPSTGAGEIDKTAAMTLRMDGSNKFLGTVQYDERTGSIWVKCPGIVDCELSLVVLSGEQDWYYSKTVEAGEIVTTKMIETALGGNTSVDLSTCQIWLETTDETEQLTYAKMAEAATIIDANGDGAFNVADLVRYMKVVDKVEGSTFANGYNGDLNGDKEVDETDVILLRKYMLHTETGLGEFLETVGMDGKLSEKEYSGTLLEGTAKDYKASVKGFLTNGNNIRLGMEIYTKYDPNESKNAYPGVGEHLFAEMAFGTNSGDGDCQLIKVNMLGETENATSIVKTEFLGDDVEYRYKTTAEVWISKEYITCNATERYVPITRFALLADNWGTETNDNLFLVAKWINLNECTITHKGIVEKLSAPEAELVGMDGAISENEYEGKVIDSTKGSSNSIDYQIMTQGYVTEGKNLRLAVTINSTRDPNTEVNPESRWSKYLFAELGFGDNNGENCTKIYADVLGNATNAVTVVNTTDRGAEAEGYRYNTIVEMWIPKEALSENPTPNMVQFTRCALFHQNYAKPAGVNETWLVLRSAWNNQGMNNCYVTTEGIVETFLLAGMDGVISENEYAGKTLDSTASDAGNYKMTVQGYLGERNDVRLGVTIYSQEALTGNANPSDLWSEYLFGEFAFGENNGEGCNTIYADVLGKTKDAVTVVKGEAMEEGSEYGYKTVIEMWISQTAIDNNPTPNKVQFTRAALFHKNLESDPETWLVLRSAWGGAGMHNCYITKLGIIDSYLLADLDGTLGAEEYAGNVLVSNAAEQVPTDQYYVEVRGKLVESKNMKIAIKIDSNIAPESSVNANSKWSENLFVEIGVGNTYASQFSRVVRADVLGQAEHAVSVVNTTENDEGSAYKYTTIIELYVPASVIEEVNSTGDFVCIPRVYIYSGELPDGVGKIVDRWDDNGGPYGWMKLTVDGILPV